MDTTLLGQVLSALTQGAAGQAGVHQVLAGIGLAEVAAVIPATRRDPQELTPSGTAGGPRRQGLRHPRFRRSRQLPAGPHRGNRPRRARAHDRCRRAAATAGLPGALT
jgi:hypothetical protein